MMTGIICANMVKIGLVVPEIWQLNTRNDDFYKSDGIATWWGDD